MNNIKINFYHPTFGVISDRTLRFILKKLSTLSREIQTHEVMYLIDQISDLPASQKQSIQDRLKEPLKHVPAYYVDKIGKGSLDIWIQITMFSLWLLNRTIGESVKEAWLKTNYHQRLVDYLSSDQRQIFVQQDASNVLKNAKLG